MDNLGRFSFEGYMIDSCASSAVFPSSWALEALADIEEDGHSNRASAVILPPPGAHTCADSPNSTTFDHLLLTYKEPRLDMDSDADSSASEYSDDDMSNNPRSYPQSINCESSSLTETPLSPSLPPLSPASLATTFSTPRSASEDTEHPCTPQELENPAPLHTGCPVCMTFGAGACTRARPNSCRQSCADTAPPLLGSDAWMPLQLHRTPSNRFAWGVARRSSVIVIAPPTGGHSREASVLSVPPSPKNLIITLTEEDKPTQIVTPEDPPAEEDTGYFADISYLEECLHDSTAKKRKGRGGTFRRVRRILSG